MFPNPKRKKVSRKIKKQASSSAENYDLEEKIGDKMSKKFT